jgi:hypothetical protein
MNGKLISFIVISLLLSFYLCQSKYTYYKDINEDYNIINLSDVEFMNIDQKEYYDSITEKIVEKIINKIIDDCHFKYKCLLYEFNNLTNIMKCSDNKTFKKSIVESSFSIPISSKFSNSFIFILDILFFKYIFIF